MTPAERGIAERVLRPGESVNRWFWPREVGGFHSSHHVCTLLRMSRKGYVEAGRNGYRLTLAAVDEVYSGGRAHG